MPISERCACGATIRHHAKKAGNRSIKTTRKGWPRPGAGMRNTKAKQRKQEYGKCLSDNDLE